MKKILSSKKGTIWSLIAVLAIFTALFGAFSSAKAPEAGSSAPASSESNIVANLLSENFDGSDEQTLLVVASSAQTSKLTAQEIEKIEKLRDSLETFTEKAPGGPIISEDEKAAVLTLTVVTEDIKQTVKDIRELISESSNSELVLYVTGGPAFGADVAASFEGADFTLLLVTILIVAVLLIFTYRSPTLWLIPLLTIALGAGLAGRLTAAAGEAFNLEFDAGIISVLVFGAGTNYALLLISRYREELFKTENHRLALAKAWKETSPAIIASNITVILALLTLNFAELPMTKGLGVPAAIGLLVALFTILFLLPPVLAIAGRKVFWPLIPKFGESKQSSKFWGRIATVVVRKPTQSLISGVLLLAVMSAGLFGTSVGLNQVEKFRLQADSATGLELLSEHFPAGEAQPITIITKTESVPEVLETVNESPGVVRAHPLKESRDSSLTSIMVTSEYTPSSPESIAQIEGLRELVHPITESLVGGQVASDLDARNASENDLKLVAPLILGVSFLILLVLLRSLLAPILLLIVNLFSAVAALGFGSWLSRTFFTQQALDPQVPLLAFLFLVALGIDYTIFLVHRARREAVKHGTRQGMIHAVSHTGTVITSAGIVLAAVFAALGVLPLVVLGQLGLIVGVGVIVDTIVVRGIIVPAIFSLFGENIWWPRKIKQDN